MTLKSGSNAPSLAVSATFTAEPLQDALGYWLKLLGLPLAPAFAPYNQVFQELRSPNGLLASNTNGVNVVLLRLADFARASDGSAARVEELLARTSDELLAALDAFAESHSAPLLVALLPVAPDATRNWTPRMAALSDELAEKLSCRKLTLIEPAELERYAREPGFDPVQDELGHVPYTSDYFAAIATAIVRRVHSLRVPARKVLVLDCDNTLWRGVVGEDGVEGITLTPGNLALQRFAVAEQERGTLICLASKNVERDVFDVFERRKDMLLKLEHVVSHRINWQSKYLNLRELAKELDLGLDSFVMIDDSGVECAELRAAAPEVLTLELPPDAEVQEFLEHVWVFDRARVTDVDRRRTELYRENAQRNRFSLTASSLEDFVRGLELVIEMAPAAESEWPRLAQLTQRTNQFNLTTRRRSEAELRALSEKGYQSLAVHVRDRFGDYGLVGLVVYFQRGDELVVDTMLLSCRVLGRCVEHTMLRELGKKARELGLAAVALGFAATERNAPARAFVESVGSPVERADGLEFLVTIDRAERAEQLAQERESAASREDTGAEAGDAPESESRLTKRPYEFIARSLRSGVAVRHESRQAKAGRRTLPGPASPPATRLERDLVRIWEELLEVEGIGVEDDFFELGGSSLLSVALLSRIANDLGRNLPITTIVEAPTIRDLAARMLGESNRDTPLVVLRPGGSTRLFLVHEGEGETLLYRGLARRLSPDVAVFGLMPKTFDGIPLAHATIEQMAAHYVDAIRSVQERGPYYLGGLCVGGTIAFEMAAQLEAVGETVALVALFDSASPTARRKQGLVRKRRLDRVGALLGTALVGGPRGGLRVGLDVVRRARNVMTYEVENRVQQAWSGARFQLLRALLESELSWPRWIPSLKFRSIVERAEKAHVPHTVRHARTVLYRATEDGAPTAFRYVYEDPELGWERHVAGKLEVVDVPGNHSSMLQEPHVDCLAASLGELIRHAGDPDRASEAPSEREFRRSA
jgi:FkbH-like protein